MEILACSFLNWITSSSLRTTWYPLVLGLLEELRQREPLPRHLVPVVGVHELVVVHAVRRVPFDPLDGGLAAVQRDDVVDEGLARLVQGQGLGWVRMPVLRRGRLADLEVLPRC